MGALFRLLFPPKCIFCGKVIESGDICTDCEKTLPYLPDRKLPRCEHIAGGAAVFRYEGSVRKSVYRYKFAGKRHYCRAYAGYLAEAVKTAVPQDFSVITWVPVSRRRLRKRGYDQSRLLAVELGRLLGVGTERLLTKKKDNPPQSSRKGQEDRKRNVSGVYTVSRSAAGRTVLLVDDVFTTGATVSECAGMLRKAGASKVYAAAVAYAGKRQ